MKRLTVHLANVKPITVETGRMIASKDSKKSIKETKKVLNNTVTIRDLESEKQIQDALSTIRSKHTIAICQDSRRSNWKAGEEMYHIANQK